MTARARGAAGQATLELLAVVPLVVAVALAVCQLLAAGAAHELAGNAAEAGAAALLQGLDPEDAARAALPGWSRSRVTVTVRARRVEVRLRPVAVVPGADGLLAARAVGHAGPAAQAGAGEWVLERTERMRAGAQGRLP